MYKIFDLGLIEFNKARQFQRQLFQRVEDGEFNSALILCRHYPVITLGRLADRRNILATPPELEKRGIRIYQVERGGDITYHGPGQLIAYPILNLNFLRKDIHWLLRQIEDIIISFLSDFKVFGQRRKSLTGVWIDQKKIASVGIAIKKWISFHGLSINIKKDDLTNFNFIKPCGMDIEMTSLETVLSSDIAIEGIKENLINRFRNVLLEKEEALDGQGSLT